MAVDVDASIALAGLAVGFLVGLTGMGGGALMTPMLVLVFGTDPLTAVSSDLVASMVMKPVGGGVHLRQGTVHRGIVRWLATGSVPGAFGGVLVLRALGDQASTALEPLLGITLLVASGAMLYRTRLATRRNVAPRPPGQVPVRPAATMVVGVAGGLIVGLTSVGSGSLMMVLLVSLYPALETRTLVGTDLVQAIPLVASAALGHLLFGDVQLGLTMSLLVGAVPAAYAGARLSSRADERWIRPALVGVLVASAARLLDAPAVLAVALGVGTALAAVVARRGSPEPATATLGGLEAAEQVP